MQTEAHREFEFLDSDFTRIVRLVKDQSGIALGERKRDLVYGRLARRLRALGIKKFSDYCEILESPAGASECGLMTNAITTNLTGFFREPHHFDFLSDEVFPALIKSRPAAKRRLRIWSAACSSGEEPYSIAMTVCKAFGDVSVWDIKILATDIDTDMIAIAKAGRYEGKRADAIPAQFRSKYAKEIDDQIFEMSPAVKSLIGFNQLNLLDPWPMQGAFDIIFCRNVVIYFDKPTQRILFDRYAEILAPGGLLFIGHSESLFQVSDRFRHLGRTIYQRLT